MLKKKDWLGSFVTFGVVICLFLVMAVVDAASRSSSVVSQSQQIHMEISQSSSSERGCGQDIAGSDAVKSDGADTMVQGSENVWASVK